MIAVKMVFVVFFLWGEVWAKEQIGGRRVVEHTDGETTSLWLNATSYSKSVWTGEYRKCLALLGTWFFATFNPYTDVFPQTRHLQNFHVWNSHAQHAVHGWSRQRSVDIPYVRRTAKMSEQAKNTIGFLSNSWAWLYCIILYCITLIKWWSFIVGQY